MEEQKGHIKPHAVEEYNRHMGHLDKGNRIANSYSISHCIWEWTKKLIFHHLNMAILNSYILLSLCGRKKISNTEFHLALIRNAEAHAGQQPHVQNNILMIFFKKTLHNLFYLHRSGIYFVILPFLLQTILKFFI